MGSASPLWRHVIFVVGLHEGDPFEDGRSSMHGDHPILCAAAVVPDGTWLVGVSGGADSVALLCAIVASGVCSRFVAAHLNHETRGAQSDADEIFVRDLAARLGIAFASDRLSNIAKPPVRHHEASYREARIFWFARLASERSATGVLLAHHADDRAETVLLRLLRGGEPSALAGVRREALIGGLRVHRPLLDIRRSEIEEYLRALGQPWREDATNTSGEYARNRARHFLTTRPELVEPLLDLAAKADRLRHWVGALRAMLPDVFPAVALGDLPDLLARDAARQWLIDRNCPAKDVSGATAEVLISMCRDRSTPARHVFPGRVAVIRFKSHLKIDSGANQGPSETIS